MMKANEIKKVACLGAGTIGSSWATYFLTKGIQVNVQDITDEILVRAKTRIYTNLKNLVNQKVISEETSVKAAGLVTYTTSIADAVKDVHFIQESALEKYEIKETVLNGVDKYAATDVIYSSSSSGLLVSKLQGFSKYPERVIIGHPFNPPHLIPLVEIVKGKADDEVVKTAYDFYLQIGKAPIVINKEVPGHVANRIQAALWRECIGLVINGVCSVRDVDTAVCSGPGLRWALMGPNGIFNLGGGDKGLEGFLEQLSGPFESWWDDMAVWKKFPKGSKEILVNGISEEMRGRDIADVVAWRDEKLIGLLKLLDK